MRARTPGYQKYMQDLAHKYIEAHGVESIDLEAVAQWAIDEGLWRPKPISPVKRCKRDLARALAVEYVEDPQGREVRGMIAFPISSDGGQMQWEWAPLFRASPEQFRLGMQTRRNGIRADCRQHKRDHESYNDNNIHGATVPLFDYDFNRDLEEESYPTEYPDDPDGDGVWDGDVPGDPS